MLSLCIALLLLALALAACSPTPEPTAVEEVLTEVVAEPTAVVEEPTAVAEEPTAEPETGACPAEGGQLVVGLSWEPSKIDPHRTAAENGVLPIMQACETLVINDGTGNFVPGLAESWELSDDGLSLTLHLREGVLFHDGTPFNADAVKHNLDRIMDPATESEEAIGHLGPYASTEVVDDNTAIVHMSEPFAALLDGLSVGWVCMVSPTAAQQWGPADFQDHFVGTGPFVFKEWKRAEYILLEKNPSYWGGPEFFAHHGNACLDSVIFRFVGEATVRTGTLQTGEIMVAQELSSTDVELLKTDPEVEIKILPAPGTGIFLVFNVSRPPLNDLKLRQAIEFAVDQTALTQLIYQDTAAPTYGPLSSVTPCYWAGAEQLYPYDPEKAKALLEEAGYVDSDGDGVREKDGTNLVLKFVTHGGFPTYRDPSPIFQAQLAEVGLQVDLENAAGAAWMEAGRTGTTDISIVDWRATDPDTNLRLPFHSSNSGAFAWNHHANAELDSLIMEGSVTLDPAARCQVYEKVQQIIMNDAMIKPLHEFSAVWGVRKDVQGLVFKTLEPSMFWAYGAYLGEPATGVNPPTVVSEEPTAEPVGTTCPKQGGQLVVGLSWEASYIDPHITAAENGVLPLMQACESLLIHTASGDYVPWLAKSWEVSDDGLSYTFHLQEGVQFHDGTPFNAEAVKYNLERIMDPETKSEEAIGHLGPYKSTEVIDDHTAVVHLASPFSPFLDGVSIGWTCMVSPAAAEQWGTTDFQDHFVGTGPFIFREWKRGEYMLLEKNPSYWGGPDFFKHHGNACLDSILFKFVGEASVRTGTLQTGEIMVAQELSSPDVELLKQDPNVSVQVLASPGTGVMLLFNMALAPTDDPKIRQALEYGIDQTSLAQLIYQDLMRPTYGPLTSVTPCYWSGVEELYPFDPEKAKALLEDAGWTDGNGDGVREKDGTDLVLKFVTHGGFPTYRDPAPIVQAELAEIGVQVDIENAAVAAWLEAGRSGTTNIGVVDWRAADPDTNLRLVFHSENVGAFAWNHHSNAELDDLLEQGMTVTDQAQRCQIYEQVQQVIMNDAMIKPLHEYAAVWGVRSEVKDLQFKGLEPSMFWAFDAYLDQ